MSDIEKARALLDGSEYTCVLCCGEQVITATERGVAPLLRFLDEGKDLSHFSAADKVVGNGAAFLYVLLKVKRLHANVISESALQTLERYGIDVSFTTLAEAIKNRAGTGCCPIETAVSGISSPNEALAAIRKKLNEMNS